MQATVDCTVVTESGRVTITLVTEDVTGEGPHDYSYVIEDDYEKRASVWWGTRLLNAYWSGVMTAAANMTNIFDTETYAISGNFSYTPETRIQE